MRPAVGPSSHRVSRIAAGGRRALLAGLSRVPVSARKAHNRVVIFCYHSIHPSKSLGNTHPRLFDLHIQWLRDQCDVVSLDEALRLAQRAGRVRPAVAITFDDGYMDLHDNALPVLAKYMIKPTLFMLTGLADGDPRVVHRMAKLQGTPSDEVSGLSWTQIREMGEAGWEIGSHTRTHINLGTASPARVLRELRTSRAILEDQLGHPVTKLAYPFGKPKHHYTPATMRLAAACGYTIGATIHYRAVRPTDSALALPRFAIANDSLPSLASKIMGRVDIMGTWQARAPKWLSRTVSRETTVFDETDDVES